MGEPITALPAAAGTPETEEATPFGGEGWLDPQDLLGSWAEPEEATQEALPAALPPGAPPVGDEQLGNMLPDDLDGQVDPARVSLVRVPDVILTPEQRSSMPYLAELNLTLKARQAAMLMGRNTSLTNQEIAQLLRMSPGTLRDLEQDPWFQALKEWEFQGAREWARAYLDSLAGHAMAVYHDVLINAPDQKARLAAARDVLDRMGVRAPTEVHVLSQSVVTLRRALGIEVE